MTVTDHFSDREFVCHDEARTPYPIAWIADRLTPLCTLLEAIRAELHGQPVRIVSGYRTPAYNAQIGGATHSQHMEGMAADVTVPSYTAREVHDLVLAMYRAGTLTALGVGTQGTATLGGLGNYPTFTHLDIRPGTRLARWSGGRSTV